ncbi:MAG: tRNA pseudouridine(38-40) synthase TruA [Bacteroidetes bacterium]|nr:tRNA pseudouridine(38-40) synthase TruA [Bacteroidota bacterium]MBV6462000.1 tRNA pseudouridine synthase A [Flavobacteriales bacterium]WKZ76605.1 MAG: tRNA pseudouridine(38-40) synthase TruA [Vicingaceae bacterium]MCL4815574.1 tRNA pseudouridine(38-40) synthase TruA [Flavobacteriales bacterium]NOG94288.1 tRNA pseudouridine(38-40) synthase TruA [Bacteroidota bacterium]
MKRFFLEISYEGTAYHGWQMQANAHSVQAEINKALSTILKEEINIVGAGRTDTGVHAKQMFAHFDSSTVLDLNILLFRLNCVTPPDISFASVFQVKENTHARFDALSRTYEYHYIFKKNPFLKNQAARLHFKPDLTVLNNTSKILFSYNDFTSFSKTGTQVKTNICNIMEAYWEYRSPEHLVFTIKANRFLRNMVRAITGTIIQVAAEKITTDDFKKIIESKSRRQAGDSVHACGLYLTQIEYPEHIVNLKHER